MNSSIEYYKHFGIQKSTINRYTYIGTILIITSIFGQGPIAKYKRINENNVKKTLTHLFQQRIIKPGTHSPHNTDCAGKNLNMEFTKSPMKKNICLF